jgi:hypothetical protein
MRAKRVPRMPKLAMIRAMTGMLVTAMASAKTSRNAVGLWAGPKKRSLS